MNQFDRIAASRLLEEGAHAINLNVSAAQCSMLIEYLALLSKWNAVYNLTAVRDPLRMVSQHLLDSLVLLPELKSTQELLDVGAGGGLPGIVIAIWALEARPDLCVSLIDAVRKKTAFLNQVKAELGLHNVCVYTSRVEQFRPSKMFDAITSRAFADLSDFVNWSQHCLSEGGRFIAMKGVRPTQEIEGLPPGWTATEVKLLRVPGLDAERHLVIIQRT